MLRLFRMFRSKKIRIAYSFVLAVAIASAQVSSSAYRVLGQTDLRQNGINMVQGVELNGPGGVALDSRGGQLHIYIADTGNSRVLAWLDVSSYQIGDAPTLVLGQPGPQYSTTQGIGVKGFTTPLGLAVDPNNGNLYVADTGNNRILRFPAPFANATRIEPDALYGQATFNTRTPGTTSTTLNQPRAVAFDSAGNLWVADTGNNRVVRFAAASLNSPAPIAVDTVVGQKDLASGGANGGPTVSANGFDGPTGLVFDSQNNLYVSDFNNTRVLRFAGPLSPTSAIPAATGVWGQANFSTRGVPQQATASSLSGPTGLSLDGSGNLYVAVPRDNRILIFPTSTAIGGAAKNVLGQSDFGSTASNAGVFPQASPSTLVSPADVRVDANGNVFVADSGNNRVLEFPSGTKTAARVWGQSDFVSNGVNQIKPGSIAYPFQMAIDYSAAPYALYVSDSANHRVLIWKDSVRFRNGDPADLVIGQPNLRTAVANVDTQGLPSRTSLSAPAGVVVNPSDGTLYVADAGNNRILRYPRPLSQAGRITPDAVIGQADFTSSTSAAVSGASLRTPAGLAFGPNGDLFVADLGNNRVLEFPAGAGTGASAIRVYGQPGMNSSTAPSHLSAQTLANPQGVAVDQAGNLYVTDTGSNRVLIFPSTQNAPPAGMAATFVIGQAGFDVSSGGPKAPGAVAVDSNGNIYLADTGNNRVLIFPPLIFLPIAGAAATGVIGQQSASGTAANWDSPDGLATADSLYGPVGLYVDRQDTLYVGDAGNSRVLQFLKPATVENAASLQASVPVAQGSIAALFGTGLASDKQLFSGGSWPVSLLNRQVIINDQLPAPVYFIGPTQANFQIPSNAPLGTQRVAVRTADTGELIAGGSLLIAVSAPGLFTVSQNGTGAAAAYNQDGTVNSATNAAPRGTVITLYGTGQGPVSPSVPDGSPAPLSPLAYTVAVPTSDAKTCQNNQPSMCVLIGAGSFGGVQFSGLIPGYIGLWQINVQIPSDAPTGGAAQVRVVINGTPSNIVTVAIR
jgi:uncharacterized protein (TIGR03437 family)